MVAKRAGESFIEYLKWCNTSQFMIEVTVIYLNLQCSSFCRIPAFTNNWHFFCRKADAMMVFQEINVLKKRGWTSIKMHGLRSIYKNTKQLHKLIVQIVKVYFIAKPNIWKLLFCRSIVNKNDSFKNRYNKNTKIVWF